jgi:hypothetical protein
MRRSISVLSLVALLAALVPAAVQAAPPARQSIQDTFLDCALTSEDGAFVSLLAAVDAAGDGFAEVAVWEVGADPGDAPPVALGVSETVEGDTTGFSGEVILSEFDPFSEPPFGAEIGTATFEVAFEPFGDPVDVSERYRFGNQQERVSGTIQPLSASGTLALPGGDTADLSACIAAARDLEIFATSPSAFNARYRSLDMGCNWDEGDDRFVSLSAFGGDDGFGFIDVFIGDAEALVATGGAEGQFDTTSVQASGDLMDAAGDVVGSFSVVATVEPTGEIERFVDRFPGGRVKVVQERLAVDGLLEVTLDGATTTYAIDAESCVAFDASIQEHFVRPEGPKPGPLANDAPEGATDLRLGRATRVVTGGNDLEAELPCTVLVEEEGGELVEVEIPFGYTVWYTVTGTGSEMTADTAGSYFDTVLAVYEEGASGLEQVVCVDDVADGEDFTLLARASWESEAGTTYWIQVGGFGESAGRLQLVVR